MKTKRKGYIQTFFLLILGLLIVHPKSVLAEQAMVCYVSEDTGNDSNSGTVEQPVASIQKALELVAEGGIIYIEDDLLVEDASNQDAPFVIEKRVTISGVGENCPVISLRAGGIILAQDVTFQNIKLGTAGFLRPGIAANGHELILVNVGQDRSLRPLQIYGGTFVDAVSGIDYGAGIRGAASKIHIIGGDYDAIYAGSGNSSIALPVSISIEKGNKLALGGVYVGSTYKSPNDIIAGSIPQLDTGSILTERVDITIGENASVNVVDGVSESNDVGLTVNGTGWYSLKIKYIDDLTVNSGTFEPASGSIFGNVAGNVPSVTLVGRADNKATLSFSKFTTENNIIKLNNFRGSEHGILFLNKNHKLSLQGNLSGGPTEFRLSGGMIWSSEEYPGYSGRIEYGTTYITGGSGSGTFAIKHPYSAQPEIAFTQNSSAANGWTTITEDITKIVHINQLVVESKTIDYADVNGDEVGVEIIATPTYAEGERRPYLYFVPFDYQISYSNMEGKVTEYRKQSSALDESERYYLCDYTASTNSKNSDAILMEIEPYENLICIRKVTSDIPAGIYHIRMTVPASFGTMTSEFTLTIKSQDGQMPMAPQPPHTHQWKQAWNGNATHHWHECNAANCMITDNSQKNGYGAHTGGIAYCNAKAVCTQCGMKYGNVNATRHTGGTIIKNAVAATASNNGYTGDTYCRGCNAKIATGRVIPATGTPGGNTGESGDGSDNAGNDNAGNDNAGNDNAGNDNMPSDMVDSNTVTGKERFVALLYENVLERHATTREVADWVQELNNGKTGATVAYGFLFSEEFTNKNLNDSSYVERLYMSMMGRPSDEDGKRDWVEHLNNGVSRLYVFKQFIDSQEFANLCNEAGIIRGEVTLGEARDENYNVTRFVARNYREFLGRDFDEGGLNNWTAKINNREQTMQEIAFGFVFSRECQNMNLSNEAFVQMLYRGCFDRAGDEAGVADWVSKLDAGIQSREDVFYGFANSQEFANMVRSYGL